jgi:hypothetical protein
MLRLVLFVIFAILVARAFWRMFDGIIEGASGPRASNRVPDRGVTMVRDPVCGTFVLPDRAVTLADGRERVHFCSESCRDTYASRKANPASSGRPGHVEGRTR